MQSTEDLRERAWNEYVGQEELKTRVRIFIEGARAEHRLVPNMLFVAPPGAGKTKLAELVALGIGDPFKVVMMKPSLDLKWFVRMLIDWEGGVLLMDEIHSASKAVQELLYTAITTPDNESYIEWNGKVYDMGHITFLGATTEPEKLLKPLWDRFLIKPQWAPYTDVEMGLIVGMMAAHSNIEIPEDLAQGLARAAAGTPRLAGALVLAYRSLAAIGEEPSIESILYLTEMDADGLTARHTAYLQALAKENGKAGMTTLRNMLQLPSAVIEDLERLLVDRDYITRTGSGRIMTDIGNAKIGNATPDRGNLEDRRAS